MNSAEIVIDEALGPGLDVEVRGGAPTIAGARGGGPWLGLDRGHLAESDAGDGTELPAVVALPASSFAGCRVPSELAGALVDGSRSVLVARLPGRALPPLAIIRTVARMGEGRWLDAAEAGRLALEARQRRRARREQGRVVGGRAWQPEVRDPGERRFTTPHSRAEYRLDRLPPRFVRGLGGLLDPDERILYSIERPPDTVRRGPLGLGLGRGAERRAGLLVLTDRQLAWLVDHVPPDRYLMDWGVDARLVALEALCGVHVGGREVVEIEVATRGGTTSFALPAELRAEADVMTDLLRRFLTPSESGGPAEVGAPAASRRLSASRALVRRYAPPVVEFDPAVVRPFGQEEEAGPAVDRLAGLLAPEPLLAAFYSPRRETVRHAIALAVSPTRVAALDETGPRAMELAGLRDIALTLSPLVGRVALAGRVASHYGTEAARARSRHDASLTYSYPASASGEAAAFIRHVRKAWADAASVSDPRAQEPPDEVM